MIRKKNHKTTHELIRLYLKRGWVPIPIPGGEKAPCVKGWTKLRISKNDLHKHFRDGDNVGLLLGEPSGGLVDVDLDATEAIAVAQSFLPPTGRRHGRRSKPNSHLWYIVEPTTLTAKFNDVDGASLVELRSTGHQTVVPPSIHPSGERIFWHKAGTPSRAGAETLHRDVARTAACALWR